MQCQRYLSPLMPKPSILLWRIPFFRVYRIYNKVFLLVKHLMNLRLLTCQMILGLSHCKIVITTVCLWLRVLSFL